MRRILATAALAAAFVLPGPASAAAFAAPALAAPVAETGLQPQQAYSAQENRAIRRCMRREGYVAGRGRQGQMGRSARANLAESCSRKLYGA
jgi:hypothetical protein